MICVKCGGQSVFPAMNEAPDGVRDYRKCMSCGMRWDPTKDVIDTVKRAFEEWQPGDDERESGGEGACDAEDRRIALEHVDAFDEFDPMDEPAASPTDLAMTDVLVKRGRKKKEKEPMPKFVSEAHRQRWIAGQKLSRQLKREAAGGGQRTEAPRKPGRPKKLPAAGVSMSAVVKAQPSVVAAEAGPIDGVCVFDRAGELMSVLDASLASAQADVHALERTREILMRGK